jgi:benzylsuccinate CoA-transferase BbsF subunit
MSKGPLAGIRVADFTWIGAGSYTTKLLSDFGADVIKVETATHMDTVRSTGPFKGGIKGTNRSGYFADRNTSKRGITLNLKHPRGKEVARRLVAQSDIVANNFRPGVMEKLGFGYEQVAAVRPDIIYLSMSMQGSEGPQADYIGFGLTIGALTGLNHLCGPRNRPPAGTSTNFPDHVPNPSHGAFALLAAFHYRQRTGRGQYIDFAQTEPMIGLLATAIVDCTANNHIVERTGNAHLSAVPHGVYPCKGEDRWVTISVYDDAQWRKLFSALKPNGNDEIPWLSLTSRQAARSEIDAWIASRTRLLNPFELMHQLQRIGVICGVVQNARDLIDYDPQLAHRKHWQFLNHPEMGRTLYNGLPVQLSRTPGKLSRPAPLLGQHTEEVCLDVLGLSPAEYESLKADRVFE